MLQLRVYGETDALTALGNELEDEGSARHLALAGGLRAGSAVLTGDVASAAADAVLRRVAGTGIPERDIALMRTDDIASPGACIALVGRRAGLAVRAITTLVVGLGAAALAAAVLTFALDLLGLLPANFEVGEVDKVWGALAVLVVNVAMIQVGGAATLLTQRRLTRRRRR